MAFYLAPSKTPKSNNALLIRLVAVLPAFAGALFAVLLPLTCTSSDNRRSHKEKGPSVSIEEPSKRNAPSLRSSWNADSLVSGNSPTARRQSHPAPDGNTGTSEKPLAAAQSLAGGDTTSANNKKNTWSKAHMVWVKAGTFTMGSIDGQDDEKPMHRATIRGFYLDEAEVTQEEFFRVMGKNPSYFKNCPACPVENVTWHDARKYCEKIGKRLPREEEWEYACRAGSATKYPWGENSDGKYAWYHENADFKTHPVKNKVPNAWALSDMSGNVWEWCDDKWRPYPGSDKGNSDGPTSSSQSRVIRGGAWDKSDFVLRSSARGRFNPDERSNNIGFRCAR
jgi:eukaryotic-like serine/threonine-protein kinase